MNITIEKVNQIRGFTGEGLLDCKKALIKAEGDVLLAIGFLRTEGCLMKTKEHEKWQLNYAKSVAEDLEIVDNEIMWRMG